MQGQRFHHLAEAPVREHHDGGPILIGQRESEDREVVHFLHGVGREDDGVVVAVPAAARGLKVVALRRRNVPETRAAALDVDDERGKFRGGEKGNAFLLEADARRGRTGHGAFAGQGRPANMIRSLIMEDGELEKHNLRLQAKFKRIVKELVRYEERETDDAEVLLVAYGTSARIAKGAIVQARAQGIPAGLLRPVTLWPYPRARLRALAPRLRGIVVVEMSAGQMIEDVQLAVGNSIPISFVGRMGGGVPEERAVLTAIRRLAKQGGRRKRT